MKLRTATLEELQQVFERTDENGDGRIGFDEFTALLLEMGDLRTGAAMRDSFERIDADHNGCIDFEELRAWLYPAPRSAQGLP